MACIFPGADGLGAYWRNIVGKVDAVGDPPEEWYAGLGSAEDRRAPQGLFFKRGGHLAPPPPLPPPPHRGVARPVAGRGPPPFPPPPAARGAAGYLTRPFNRERTEVILGRGAYINRGNPNMLQHGLVVEQTVQVLARLRPELGAAELDAFRRELVQSLPPCSPDMAAGLV